MKKLLLIIILLVSFSFVSDIVKADTMDYVVISQVDSPGISVSDEKMKCTDILGKTLSKVVKSGIVIIQIAAGIIALVKGMLVLIPPLVAKDADALKKASGTLVKMAIILVLVLIFRPFARLLGTILDFDISCII